MDDDSQDARLPPREPDLEKNEPSQLVKDDAFLVKFEENEGINPRNWSNLYKAWITLQLGFLALTGSIGSSIISPAAPIIEEEFNVSREIVVLTVALYVLGFALG